MATNTGWYTVLKGAAPSLSQLSATRAVKTTTNKPIMRGSLVVVDVSTGAFRMPTAQDATDVTAMPFIAMQAESDFTAGMAGTYGQGNVNTVIEAGGAQTAGAPVIGGLAINMPLVIQTNQFDVANKAAFTVGTYLTLNAAGQFAVRTSDAENIVGQVEEGAKTRWVNELPAIDGRRTGATTTVIAVRTLWLPAASASAVS